jgi:hypothetical protein
MTAPCLRLSFCLDLPCQTKIHDPGFFCSVIALFNENVRGFYIAVNDANAMRLVYRQRNLFHDMHALFDGKTITNDTQRLAVDVLHRNIWLAIHFARFVNATNVLVLNTRLRSCFAKETRPHVGVASFEEFQGDGTTKFCIDGAIDCAHPAFANELDAFVPLCEGYGYTAAHGP